MNANTMKTSTRWLTAAAAAAVIAAGLATAIGTDSAAPADTGGHPLAAIPTIVMPTMTIIVTKPHPTPIRRPSQEAAL